MPIGDFFRVLRRRWLLVLVGFLLTVGLSGAAYWFFKPTYEITGTVLLLPPASSATTGSSNPYLQLGGLQQTVDLVGVSLTDQTTTLEMQGISKDVEFSVKADVRTSSPLLVVDVKASSPETALKIRDILVARVPVRLDALQQSLNVSTKDRVTSKVLTLDTEAQEVGKNRLRAGVVAGVLGIGLTLVVAALWDASRLRHPRRRAPGRLASAPGEATSPPTEAVLTAAEELPAADAVPVSDAVPGAAETDPTPSSADSVPSEGVLRSEEAVPSEAAVLPPDGETDEAAQPTPGAPHGVLVLAHEHVVAPVDLPSPPPGPETLEVGADASGHPSR